MCLMDNIEFLILKNLLHNEEYVRKVIPFIKADYFEDLTQKIVFEEIFSFVEQYNKPATKEILCICFFEFPRLPPIANPKKAGLFALKSMLSSLNSL